jgi:hypothetical protein
MTSWIHPSLTQLQVPMTTSPWSIYIDDVITFRRLTQKDTMACLVVLEDFGEASGLRKNIDKYSVLLLRWDHGKPPWQLEVTEALSSLFKSTLMALPAAMMAWDLSTKSIVMFNNIEKGFHWKWKKDIIGRALSRRLGSSLHVVFGIPNLRNMNNALQTRWIWLKQIDPTKFWKEFGIHIPQEAQPSSKGNLV